MGRKASAPKRPGTLPIAQVTPVSSSRAATGSRDSVPSLHLQGSRENPIIIPDIEGTLENPIVVPDPTPPNTPLLTPDRLADIESELAAANVNLNDFLPDIEPFLIPVVINGQVSPSKRKTSAETSDNGPRKKQKKSEYLEEYFEKSLEEISASARQGSSAIAVNDVPQPDNLQPGNPGEGDILGAAVNELFGGVYKHGGSGTPGDCLPADARPDANALPSSSSSGNEDTSKKRTRKRKNPSLKVNIKLAERNRHANLFVPSLKPISLEKIPDSWEKPERVFFIEGEQSCSIDVFTSEPSGVVIRRFIGKPYEKQAVLSTEAVKHLYASVQIILEEHRAVSEEVSQGLTNPRKYRIPLAKEQDVHLAVVSYFGKVKIHLGTDSYVSVMIASGTPSSVKEKRPCGMVIPVTLLQDLDQRIGPICADLLK